MQQYRTTPVSGIAALVLMCGLAAVLSWRIAPAEPSQAAQAPAAIRHSIESRFPGAHVLDVQPSAIPGLYEVFLGDQIVYSGVRGRIVRIGLVNTWIRTEDGNLAFVGNTSLLGGPFTNLTAKVRFPEYLDDVPRSLTAPVPSPPAPPPVGPAN